jgi:hypothetical protein
LRLNSLKGGRQSPREVVGPLDQPGSTNRASHLQIPNVAQNSSSRLLCPQRRFRPFRYQAALFFGQRGIKMQHERIGIPAKLCDDERYARNL